MVSVDMLVRLLVTAALLLATLIARTVSTRAVHRAMKKSQGAKRLLVTRVTNAAIWVGLILLLVVTWGGSVESIWLTATGIIGISAIGFLAVWSMLSNIVAGMILLLVKHYDIGDDIEIVGDKVKGRIVDITAFFVVLKQKRTTTLIPNNVFIQKMVKKR